jgi:hypothetical protein
MGAAGLRLQFPNHSEQLNNKYQSATASRFKVVDMQSLGRFDETIGYS